MKSMTRKRVLWTVMAYGITSKLKKVKTVMMNLMKVIMGKNWVLSGKRMKVIMGKNWVLSG